MAVLRRVIHHALYYLLLGPLIGGLIPGIYNLFSSGFNSDLKDFPENIAGLICAGGIPALITGILVAFLPARIWLHRKSRCQVSGAIGVMVSLICYAVLIGIVFAHLHSFGAMIFLSMLIYGVLINCIAPGYLAGFVMGRLIEHLPGLGNARPKTDSLS